MAALVMHRIAVELITVLHGYGAALRITPAIALAIVEVMVNVAVEVLRSVEPTAGPDEDSAVEPLRAIVAIRSAIVRRSFVVPIRAHGRFSNADSYLR